MRMGGCDDAMLAQLAEILLAESPKRVGEIEDGLKRQDAVLVTRGAHTLKGAAGNFGAIELVKIAEEIEELARDDNLTPIPDLLAALMVEAKTMDEELNTFRSSVAK